MYIKGKIVTIRAIEESDLEMIRGMFNDCEIENLVIGWAFPISSVAQKQWWLNNYSDQKNHRFVIETEYDGIVGIATLTDIDWKNRVAHHGIKLANRQNRTKGIGTDSVMAVMKYAFDELQLHRLEGSWFAFNEPSVRLYKKCGWKEEGVKRSCIYKNGEYRDLIISGILESDYRELIERNNYWGK